MASPGENSGQWVVMATPEALPQRPLGSRKGPLPCLQGTAPAPAPSHPVPAFIPSFAHQIWIGRRLSAGSGDLVMNMAG